MGSKRCSRSTMTLPSFRYQAPDIPFAGEHRGKEAIRQAHELAWNMCETEPMWNQDFNLLVSDDMVVLSGKKGLALSDGRTVELWFHQIFTVPRRQRTRS